MHACHDQTSHAAAAWSGLNELYIDSVNNALSIQHALFVLSWFVCMFVCLVVYVCLFVCLFVRLSVCLVGLYIV